MDEWDGNEPARSLAFLQLEDFKAAREGRAPDHDDLVERLILMLGSERAALLAVAKAAGETMVEMAGDLADAVDTHLTLKAFRSV